MQIVDEGFVVDAEHLPGSRRAHTFTSLCRLRSGTILITYRRGTNKDSPDGTCVIARSTDGGATWQEIFAGFETAFEDVPGEIRAAELAERVDGVLLAALTWIDRSRGERTLYDRASDMIRPSRLLLSQSTDGGATWSLPRVLPTGAARCPVLAGPVVHVPGRGWLITFERQEPEFEGGPSVHAARALFGHDGRRFDTDLTVARHPDDRVFYYDQRQTVSPDGRPVAAFWSYDREAERDLDIHLAWGSPDSLTWNTPRPTGITGQIGQPIALPDDRLLLFYVRRHPPCGMRLIAAEDGGHHWDHAGELIVHGHAPDEAADDTYDGLWDAMPRWTFGHPTAVVLDPATLLLAHYAGTDASNLSVRWCRVAV